MQDFSPSLYSPLVLLMENVFLAIFIFLCFLILYLYKNKRSYLITAFPLGALSAHQVEEYILSPMLLGEKYHFLEWAYRSGVYISPMEVATVNTIPYLLTPLLFLFNPSKKIFAILFLLTSSMLLSNGMFHIGVASAQTDYSPGLITSLFIGQVTTASNSFWIVLLTELSNISIVNLAFFVEGLPGITFSYSG